MNSRMPAQRLAVLVDTAYVYGAARRLYDERLDYRRLLDFVADVLGASCGAFARGLLGRLAMRLRPSKEPSS